MSMTNYNQEAGVPERVACMLSTPMKRPQTMGAGFSPLLVESEKEGRNLGIWWIQKELQSSCTLL